MAEWLQYKIDMKLVGRLTQIPDSQKIFGALVYLFGERYSAEQASQLVDKLKKGELYIALSNMLPHGYLPVPHTFLLDQLSEERNDSHRKQIYQALKKRSFVEREQLQNLLKDPANAERIYPYVTTKLSQQIHASIDSKRYNLPGLDPNLYSVPEITVTEIKQTSAGMEQEREEKQTVSEFSFFLALEESEESLLLLSALQDAKEDERLFILGARASQGLNTFHIKGIQQEPHCIADQPGEYLNLGMLLPKNIDLEKSSLKLFTSERRPYNPPGGWDGNMVGNFISFIEAGSLVYVTEGISSAGCSVPSPFHPRDIVFGQAFLYPMDRSEDVIR